MGVSPMRFKSSWCSKMHGRDAHATKVIGRRREAHRVASNDSESSDSGGGVGDADVAGGEGGGEGAVARAGSAGDSVRGPGGGGGGDQRGVSDQLTGEAGGGAAFCPK